MGEEACCDGLATLPEGFIAGDDGIAIAVHESEQLLPDILGSAHGSELDEVLVTPHVAIVVLLPLLVDRQKSQVVALRLMEPSLLLIRH